MCPSDAVLPTHAGATHTECCPSKNAKSADGPQAGYGGRPGSRPHWRPEPSPHSARTTVALVEVLPHPWSGWRREWVVGRRQVLSAQRAPLFPICTSPRFPVSLAKWHHHGVVLDATEQSPLLQCSQHCLPSLKPGQALNRNGLITAMPFHLLPQPSTVQTSSPRKAVAH